jgi:hypothetical protein
MVALIDAEIQLAVKTLAAFDVPDQRLRRKAEQVLSIPSAVEADLSSVSRWRG